MKSTFADRNFAREFIKNSFEVLPDKPWAKFPDYEVFRHRENSKWFALMMNISSSKLGIGGDEKIDVLNVKSNPIFINSLIDNKKILPPYHMKGDWVTIVLNNTVQKSLVEELIEMSFELTRSKRIKKKDT